MLGEKYGIKSVHISKRLSKMPTIQPEDLNILTNKLGILFFEDTLKKHPKMQKLFKQRIHELVGTDFYNLLYHANPHIKEQSPNPALAAYLELLLMDSEVEELRMQTIMDRRKSATGSIKLFQELMRQANSALKTIIQLGEVSQQQKSNEAVQQAIKQVLEQQAQNLEISKEMQEAISNANSDMQIQEMLGGLGAGKGGQQDRFFEQYIDEELIDRLGKQDTLRRAVRFLGKIESQ